MFSREFSEISKNTFSYRTPPVTASVLFTSFLKWGEIWNLKQSDIDECKVYLLFFIDKSNTDVDR